MKNPVLLFALFSAAALTASANVLADPAPASFRGGLLVDSSGMTLYTFDKDPAGGGKSVCNAQCAGVWPPLAAPAGSAAGGDFAEIARDDGSKQIAYKGRPLYRYAPDQKPGDMTGDNSGGVWHVVRSEPAKATQKPAGAYQLAPGY